MMKISLLWFLMLITVLTYSASATKSTAQHGDFRTSKSQIQTKYMYGVMMGSSKEGNQRIASRLHHVVHRRSFKNIAKPVNGGGSNDLLRHPGRRSSDSFSIKPSSLFMAALKNLIFGLFLFVCFF